MRYVELVDFHRKGIAMTINSGDDLTLDKPGSWANVTVKTRDRWLFGLLTAASFLTLQTLLAVGPKEIANDVFLTISLWVFALVLPMNVLLVLLTYARKKELNPKVRLWLEWIAALSTVIGIDLAFFFHGSWRSGILFTVASVIAGLVAFHYVHISESKAHE
jgi:hypothetical protein